MNLLSPSSLPANNRTLPDGLNRSVRIGKPVFQALDVMIKFIVNRCWQAFLVLWVMSLLVFAGVFAIGNPLDFISDPQATSADIASMAHNLGLDHPLWYQYGRFLLAAVHGDLGRSFLHAEPALSLIWQRFPATLELAVVALLLAIVLGIPLGMVAGFNPHRWYARLISTGSMLGFSLPTFWVGLILIMFFSIHLGWLPANGRGETRTFLGVAWSILTLDGWLHLILPALNLALFKISLIIRLAAAGTREAMQLDCVRFAQAKGLPMRHVVGRHVLKTILIPIVTVLGMEFAALLAFSVVTESIFAWPGMGKLLLDSIYSLDRPVVVAYLLSVSSFCVAINLVVDVLYMILDPRIRV